MTLAARGLILDQQARRFVATPFPKFFNAGEHGQAIPDLEFETTEKLDGSLIIMFHHRGRWRTATKAAFNSNQAIWAQAQIDKLDPAPLSPGTTYLAEATYPENRIVVHYAEPALRMLAAYDDRGIELHWPNLVTTSGLLGLGTAQRLTFGSVKDMMAVVKTLP